MFKVRHDKTLGYDYIIRDGEKIYYHRYVAEQIVGRKLKETEVVHHKDRNRKNNNVDNLIVFKTEKDHGYHHSYEEVELIRNEDGTYSFPVEQLIKKCPNCEKEFLSHNTMFCCRKCVNQYQSKNNSNRPSYEELENDLRTMSYVAIGRKYNISDNGVRKWCKFYGLPTNLKEKKEFFNLKAS